MRTHLVDTGSMNFTSEVGSIGTEYSMYIHRDSITSTQPSPSAEGNEPGLPGNKTSFLL